MQMSVKFKMVCGHSLEHSCFATDQHAHDLVYGSSDAANRAVTNFAEMLQHWITTRMKNHDCSLVSPENPTGNKHQKGI